MEPELILIIIGFALLLVVVAMDRSNRGRD